MAQKIKIYAAILVGLIALSLFVLYRAQKGDLEPRPLLQSELSNLNKITIDEPGRSVTLEKKEKVWRVTAPVDDAADAQAVDQLIGTLTSFSVGSVISEKKDKYSSFELQNAQATRVRAYQAAKDTPILDMYVGKQAISFGTSYVRFSGKDPVYIANNLPNWVLIKPLDEYRDRKIIAIKKDDITRLEFFTNGFKQEIKKSSMTWTLSPMGKPLEESIAPNILQKLDALKASQIEDNPPVTQKLGLGKPVLTIKAFSETASNEATIGAKKTVKKGEPDPNSRYVEVGDRNGFFLLDNASIDELLGALKTLPK